MLGGGPPPHSAAAGAYSSPGIRFSPERYYTINYTLSQLPMASDDSEFFRSLFRAYLDSANDGVFVLCDEMKFHVANPLLQSWIGVSESDLTAHNCRMPITRLIGNPASARHFEQQFHKALSGEPVRFECLISPEHTTQRWLEISLNKVKLEAGDMFIGIARDITERKGLLEKIEYHSTHDPLTGLVNRLEFERHLHSLLQEPRDKDTNHALIFLDLDNFKLINDTCGPTAGDLLLQQISQLIQKRTRKSDLLARLGGNEFGVLLRQCPVAQANRVAESYLSCVKDFRLQWLDKQLDIGASIGVVPILADSSGVEDIMGYAETACHIAKERGGNLIQLYTGQAEFSQRRQASHWVSAIRAALDADRFQLFFQRIVPLAPTGAGSEHREILLRMLDVAGGLISPAEFMPAAEKFHLMPLVDRWVVRHLFEAYRSHPQRASEQYAINLSGASLNDDGFPDFLRALITEYAIPPAALCFEITETVAIRSLQRASDFIHQLREIGCRFALDDFGAGMSSFAYLRALNVDYLKIDGSLVRDVHRDPVSRVMVDAIHQIGRAMGIQTIAEFAENEAIIASLRQIGVDYAQGYGIHRPEPL